MGQKELKKRMKGVKGNKNGRECYKKIKKKEKRNLRRKNEFWRREKGKVREMVGGVL